MKKTNTSVLTIPVFLGTSKITNLIELLTNSLADLSHTIRDLYLDFNKLVIRSNPGKLLVTCEESFHLISIDLSEYTQTFVEITKNAHTPFKPGNDSSTPDVVNLPKESLIYDRIMSQVRYLETQLDLTDAIYNLVTKKRSSPEGIDILKQVMIKTLITATNSTKILHTNSSIQEQP
jgi:hypothetical protein